jgi:hypothetical protein
MRLPYLHFLSAYKNKPLNLALMGGFPMLIMLWLLMIGGILIFDTSDNMWLKSSL